MVGDRVVVVKEAKYKEVINPDSATADELGVIEKLAGGFSMPLGRPSHKNGCYARVMGTVKEGDHVYLSLLSYPFSALDPAGKEIPADFFIMKEANIEELPDGTNVNDLVSKEKNLQKRRLQLIKNSFNTAYAGRWADTTGGKCEEILVHYPEINITNSRNSKHMIRDLFVKFNFISNLMYMNAPSGRRLTKTIDELNYNYNHSHLSTGNAASWQTFCFGDTSITKAIENLRSTEITEDLLTGFLLHFESYLQWESLEGGPYCHIAEIGKVRAGRAVASANVAMGDSWYQTDDKLIVDMARALLQDMKPEDLKFEQIRGRFVGSPIVQVDLDNKKLLELVSKACAFAVGKTSNRIARKNTLMFKFNVTKNKYEVARDTYLKTDVNPATTRYQPVKDWCYGGELYFRDKIIRRTVVLEEDSEEGEKDIVLELPAANVFSKIIGKVNSWLSQESLVHT